MEKLNPKPSYSHFSKKSVLELERVFLKNMPLLVRCESQIHGFLASLFGSRLG